MENEEIKEMVIKAKEIRKIAYSKYSGVKVGAVLKTKTGKLYTGCNIENYGIQSICAERVAFVKALSEGETEFESILVIGGRETEPERECFPCGYCRQFMLEYTSSDFKIYTVKGENINLHTLDELLPKSFE